MGLYINPRDISKEEWLDENNINKSNTVFDSDKIGIKNLMVCLMDNGLFTAAGVAFDEREVKAFSDPTDRRPKTWFVVKKADLKKVCGEEYNIYVQEIH